MPDIYHKTNLSQLPIATVQQLLNTADDLEARHELLLRSWYGGNFNQSVTGEYAFNITEEGLKRYPEDVILHWVAGRYSYDGSRFNEAEKHFLFIKNFSYHLFKYSPLIYLYNINIKQKNYIKAYVWLTSGILSNIESCENLLMEVVPKENIKHLIFCAFLVCILSNKKFQYLDYSKLINSIESPSKELFEKTNAEIMNISDLFDKNSNLAKLSCYIISLHPKNYLEFFIYCFKNKIIAGVVFEKIVNHFVENSSDNVLLDRARYELALHFLNQNNILAAQKSLDLISAKFTEYQLSDFNIFPKHLRDKISYHFFNKFYQNKNYEDAFKFLNNVESPQCFDKNALEIFSADELFSKTYSLVLMKKNILKYLTAHSASIQNLDLIKLICKENVLFNDPFLWSNIVVDCVLHFLTTNEIDTANFKEKLHEFFNHEKEKRTKLIKLIQTIKDESWFNSLKEAEIFLSKVLTNLENNQLFFSGTRLQEVFNQAKFILTDGIAQLSQEIQFNDASKKVPTIVPTSIDLSIDNEALNSYQYLYLTEQEQAHPTNINESYMASKEQAIVTPEPPQRCDLFNPTPINSENSGKAAILSVCAPTAPKFPVELCPQNPFQVNDFHPRENVNYENDLIDFSEFESKKTESQINTNIERIVFPSIPESEPSLNTPFSFFNQPNSPENTAIDEDNQLKSKMISQ